MGTESETEKVFWSESSADISSAHTSAHQQISIKPSWQKQQTCMHTYTPPAGNLWTLISILPPSSLMTSGGLQYPAHSKTLHKLFSGILHPVNIFYKVAHCHAVLTSCPKTINKLHSLKYRPKAPGDGTEDEMRGMKDSAEINKLLLVNSPDGMSLPSALLWVVLRIQCKGKKPKHINLRHQSN